MNHSRLCLSLLLLAIPPAACSSGGGGGGGGDGGGGGSGAGAFGVVSISPADGATGVGLASRVVVTFDKPLTAPAGSWMSVQGGSAAITGELSRDAADPRRLVFTPRAALAAATQHTIQIDTSVTAADGSRLAGPVTARFSTGSSAGGTGMRVSALRDLAESTDTFRSLRATRTGSRTAVTWIEEGDMVGNAFSNADGAWTATQRIAGDLRSGFRPTPTGDGGIVVLDESERQALVFRDAALSGPVPMGVVDVVDVTRSPAGRAMIVNRPSSVGGVATAELTDVGRVGWSVVNASAPVAFVARFGLLPSPTGYQFVGVDAGDFVASQRGLDGSLVNEARFPVGDPFAVSFVASSVADERAIAVLAIRTPTDTTFAVSDFDPASGWTAPAPIASLPDGSLALVLVRVGLAADGSAAIVFSNLPAPRSTILWREAGQASWASQDFPSQLPLGIAVSAQAGVLVVGLADVGPGETDGLVFIGKRPGAASPWTGALRGSTLGLNPDGLLVSVADVATTSGADFVVGLNVVRALRTNLVRGARITID